MSNILQNLDWTVVYGVIPALICLTFHELAHAVTAYWLGDNTAKNMGRLTLNPIKHIDPFGLIAMIVFRFGWAKPVPVNMMNFSNPKRYMAATALAGPVSNVILAVISLFVLGILIRPFGGVLYSPLGEQGFYYRGESIVLVMVERTAYLNIALAIFNMIPIPPLDGSKVVFSVISDDAYFKLMRYERYGMIVLILLISTEFFNRTVGHAVFTIYERFSVVAQAAFHLVN